MRALADGFVGRRRGGGIISHAGRRVAMHHVRGKLGTLDVISYALYRLDRNI